MKGFSMIQKDEIEFEYFFILLFSTNMPLWLFLNSFAANFK